MLLIPSPNTRPLSPSTNTCTFLPSLSPPTTPSTPLLPPSPHWLAETATNGVKDSIPLARSHLERRRNAMSPPPQR